MRNISQPHTVIVFTHQGRKQTMTRLGHLPARSRDGASVEGVMQACGVSGPVIARHHEGAMFGKAPKLAAVFEHGVKSA